MFVKIFVAATLCGMVVQSGSPTFAEDPAPRESIGKWIDELNDDSYLRRKRATKELIAVGRDAIGPLVDVTDRGDLETTERAITVLQEIAIAMPLLTPTIEDSIDPTQTGADVWDRLEKLSVSGGSRAARANMAMDEIRDIRRVQATERLTAEGVSIGISETIVSARSELKRIVHVDEAFQGDDSLLRLLRWIDEIQYARILGPAIRPGVLRGVVTMPELQTIAMMQGTIDMESLRVLGELQSIRHLEFRYVTLSGEMVDYLASLPITVSLTLMGTSAPLENVEALRRALPGLHLEFKQGGFLGVRCYDNGNQCEINEVVPLSGAEKAGLIPGDIVIGLDDKVVTRFSELQDAINSHLPGDAIKIKFIRDGVEREATAMLGKLEQS